MKPLAALAMVALASLLLPACSRGPQQPVPLVPAGQAACTDQAAEITTGQQYVDADNGVPPDRWSLLVRWQGDVVPGPTPWVTQPVEIDLGRWTGLQLPPPVDRYQRGRLPGAHGGPPSGVQLRCRDAGMLLSSWEAPHENVLGGGWNDMYGYAWAPERRPRPFRQGDAPAELLIEGRLAIPTVAGHVRGADGAWETIDDLDAPDAPVSVQYNFFAYLRDTTHLDLPPIAVLAAVYGNGPSFTARCEGVVAFDYPEGVWFAGGAIHPQGDCPEPWVSAGATEAHSTNRPFAEPRWYRVRITPENLDNIVRAVNAVPCAPGSCPRQGYSADPGDYALDYFGVILETTVCTPANGAGRACSTAFDDRQVVAGARASDLMAWSLRR